MARILLRSGKDPFQVLPPELALETFPSGVWGRNVGNLVFGDAMHRLLSVPGSEVVTNSFLSERKGVTKEYVGRVNEEFDHFVIPLANAFRTSFMGNLGRLTKVIEGLTIPVTVAGVGVAGGPNSITDPFPRLTEEETANVTRFIRAVLDHSPAIGVRGEFTRAYLASLGFGDEHVDVVGCPSLFRDGTDLAVEKRAESITPESQFTMNLSPYVKMMAEVSVRHAEKYPNMIYIPQGHDTLELMMWGKEPERISDPRMPDNLDHPLYQSNRIRFFVDTRTWIDFLKGQDFSFGTRIHGNIAALSARTPAVVLAHDARTLELAEYHEIPHRLVPELTPEVDAAELYDWADFTAFNTGHAARFEKFATFLKKCGLEQIHEDGKANTDYDARLAALPLPAPVQTLMSNEPEARRAAIERVALLRKVAGPRAWTEAFPPEFAVPVRRSSPAPADASATKPAAKPPVKRTPPPTRGPLERRARAVGRLAKRAVARLSGKL